MTQKIKFCILQVIQINLSIIPGHQALNLWRGKHVQPLRIDDAAEASDKSSRLLLYLRVHSEVGHEVDVADPAANRNVGVVCQQIHLEIKINQ